MWSCNVKKEEEKRILSSNELEMNKFYFKVHSEGEINKSIVLLYKGWFYNKSNEITNSFIQFMKDELPSRITYTYINENKYQLINEEDIDFEINITLKDK